MKKTLLILALAVGGGATGLALKSTLANVLGQSDIQRSEIPSGKAKFKLVKFSKKVKVNDQLGPAPIAIRLNGLRRADVVNIRPAEKPEIEVTAGVLVNKNDGGTYARLPESALELTPGGVIFTRPRSFDETVLLNIQLPSESPTEVMADGRTLLNSVLREPISVRDGEVGQGEASELGLLLRAAVPAHVKGLPAAGGPAAGGRRLVPFSDLRVIKKVDVDIFSPKNRAMLEINEEGKVVRITLLGSDPDSGLEDALKQWQFAPYMEAGRPVAVVTVLSPSQRGQ
jgi:hypothetical protein